MVDLGDKGAKVKGDKMYKLKETLKEKEKEDSQLELVFILEEKAKEKDPNLHQKTMMEKN